MGDQQIDAEVDSFFSIFDEKEDISDSSSETKEVEKTEVLAEPKDKETSKEQPTDQQEESEKENTPFHKHPRWQSKIKENNDLKQKVTNFEKEKRELLEKIEALENTPLSDERLEQMSPKEIQEYTRQQYEKEFNKKAELEKVLEQEVEKYIEDSLEAIKDSGFELTQDKENEIMKIANEYTNGDIPKAFELFQRFNETKEVGKQEEATEYAKKQMAQSNRNNRPSGGGTTGFVRGTSWNSLNLN